MTPAQFATYVRSKTRTNTTTLPDATLLAYANIAKNDICEQVVETDEAYFDMVLTRNLEAGVRVYDFDTRIMGGFRYVQAKLNGEDLKHLSPYNLNQLRISTNESGITSYMAGRPWGYYISGQSLYLLNDAAIVDVQDGIEMTSSVYPADITDLSSTVDMSEAPSDIEFGIPLSLHELMARRVIIEHKTSQTKPLPLTEREQKFDSDLKEKVKLLTGQNVDEDVTPTSPYNDGSNY